MPWKRKPFGWGKSLSAFDHVLETTEASIEALKQLSASIASSNPPHGCVSFEVDTVEPPSIDTVLKLFGQRQGFEKVRFKRRVCSIPMPNPRDCDSRFPVWKFRFGNPIPNGCKPGPEAIDACVELAKDTMPIQRRWSLAKSAVQKFELEDVPELIAVTVHPPASNVKVEPWTWLRNIQLSAILVATHVEIENGVTLEQSRVVDLTYGPLDWCIDSALIALTLRALDGHAQPEEVVSIAKKVESRIPDEGCWTCGMIAESVQYFLKPDPEQDQPSDSDRSD